MDNAPWKSLSKDTGTQTEMVYAGQERMEIRSAFSFNPIKILDIGCANGDVSAALKKDYPNVYAWGIEINPKSAAHARLKLDRISEKPLDQFDAAEQNELVNIDTVLLLDVLEHIYNPWELLQTLSQHINSDAQVIVSLPNIAHANVFRDMADGYWHYQSAGLLDVTHIRFFTQFEMIKMFYETGFKVSHKQHQGDYCADPEQYQNRSFPVWVDFGNIKIIAKDYEHWITLNSRQIIFRLHKAVDSELNEHELHLKYSAHPDTKAF